MSPVVLPRPIGPLVRLVSRLVPRSLRAEWLQEWTGELVYLRRHTERSAGGDLIALRRCLGCVVDAFWIRTSEWSPEMLLQDLRFALRTHLKHPGFAAVAILTLALGIGANTALFSVVNALLLEPLSYPESQQLVRLYGTNSNRGLTRSNMNPNDLLDVRDNSTTFAGLAYHAGFSGTLTVNDEPMVMYGGSVHSSFFDVLGARPHLGRFFTADEDIDGNDAVAVLSYETWVTLFGSDSDIIGRRLGFDTPHTVVGVAPQDFRDPFNDQQLWTAWGNDSENRGGHFMRAIARLAPDATLAQALQELDAIYAGIAETHDKPTRGITAVPLQDAIVQDTRPLLILLFGAVGFLLLVVCANIASLMLARAVSRRQEVAVRMALGAGRGRLVRQFLNESLLLVAAAGVLGLAFAFALVQAAAINATAALPALFDVRLDGRVLGFCLLVTVAAGMLFSLAPALHGSRADLADTLRERGTEAGAGGRRKLRSTLVVVEVALSLMLLIGAGLMARSLGNLMSVDPGFEPTGVLSFQLEVPSSSYPEYAQSPAFYEQFMERLRGLPGVEAVGAINRLPFGGSYSCDFFMLDRWPLPEPGQGDCAEERVIAGDYFAAMGIEIVDGRPFETTDDATGRRVVLVSESMANRFMPGEDPIERGFFWGVPDDDDPYRRVVGVVADIKHTDLTSDSMTEVYMPHEQYPYYREMAVVVRAPDPLGLVPAVREALRALDPNIPIYNVAALADLVDSSLAPARAGAQALGAFAVLALVLACVGLYGVLAYTVSQRTHEFGVRMALGARGNEVVSMVLGQAMNLVGLGIAIGLIGAWALSGALNGVLFGIGANDVPTYLVTAMALLAVSVLAAYVPAHRATKVDPVSALRAD